MGQYWKPVNLGKKEYIEPHKLGSGLKLWEQLAAPGVGQAMIVLLGAMPERRGSGDLEENPIIGHWAGDRVAIIGDYAEVGDCPVKEGDVPLDTLWQCCQDNAMAEGAPDQFTDVTDAVHRGG